MIETATDTKTRILDAAERLFAEHGIGATSLRSVIAEAGVNLAAVHYHFGSKEGLTKAVVSRRVDPLNEKRLEMLAECEKAAGRRKPSLAGIVEAFIGPPLRVSRESEGGATFMKLMGRLLAEPGYFFGTIVPEKFQEIGERFMKALEKALPALSDEEILWRLHFGIGAMAHAMLIGPDMARVTKGVCDGTDVERTIARLVNFIVAGLQAPARRAER
jgi:AcrR family transcriptional regulator